MLTMNSSSPVNYWGCEATLTRLEIVVECTFTTLNDGAKSSESQSELLVVYGQLGRLVNLQHLLLDQKGDHPT